MPVISRFYGILIVMYFNDHSPPHLHAKYSGLEALFNLEGLPLQGSLPTRAEQMVREWIRLHKIELEQNWARAKAGNALLPITPLE